MKEFVAYIEPIEERIDTKHDWVKPYLVSLQLKAEVYHHDPVEAERDPNKPNRQILDFFRRADNGYEHDEEQESGRSNGVLHESDDGQNRVAFPYSHVCQHADLIRYET